VLQGFHFDLFY